MTNSPAPTTASHAQTREDLSAEARALYQAIFRAPAPDAVVRAYVRAHQHYCATRPGALDIAAAIREGAGIEALELALRARDPLLSHKCRLLVYIAEATPEGYARLVNTRDQRVRAWAALAAMGVRTVVLRLKGALVARRTRRA